MSDPYELVSSDMPSNPDRDGDYLFVHLYPYNNNMESYCGSNSIVTNAIETAAGDLLSYGAIDGWEITRFRTSHLGGDGNYFENVWGDSDTRDEIGGYFYDKFITETKYSVENLPTGYGDLSGYLGAHHLIHDKPEGCYELGSADEENGLTAPAGANANENGTNSFVASTGSWAPVCSDTKLTKSAALQEILHTFIDEAYQQDFWGTITTDSGYEDHEHTLGKVFEVFGDRICTPMLTYHWDDNITDNGDCASYTSDPVADTHSPQITKCTKRAIEDTAINS